VEVSRLGCAYLRSNGKLLKRTGNEFGNKKINPAGKTTPKQASGLNIKECPPARGVVKKTKIPPSTGLGAM